MKVDQTYLEDHQLKVTVETDQESFDKAKHKAARELSKDKKIPGYRPGKAPYQLIVNHIGEGVIVDHALETYLDDIYPQVLDEIEGEPYGPGRLQEIKSLEPPTFEFLVPLEPEINLGDYHDIRIPYEENEVGDEEVQDVIERMLSQQATIEEVDHPAEVGSLVDTEISGRPIDADPDDEEAQIMTNQPLPVMIKSEDEDDSKEWPFPGFSRQLLGVSPGDALQLNYEYDDDESVDDDLRGKEVLFDVRVEGIRQRVLPELDDEFVQSVSEEENVEAFKDQIREELINQSRQEDENSYLNAIFEEIIEDSEIKYPPQMLENEIEGEIQEISQRLQAQGMELDMYLDMQDMELEDLKDQIRPEAEKRIRRGLILGRIAEEEELDISPEKVTNRFQEVVEEHFGPEGSPEREQFMNSRESMSLLNQLSSQMISQHTLDYLKALAQGKDTSEYKRQEQGEEGDIEDEELAEMVEESPAIDAEESESERTEGEDDDEE